MFHHFVDQIAQLVNRLGLENDHEPATATVGSNQSARTRLEDSRIRFARLVNGKLKLFMADPDELDYIAFSHVWGKWTWRKIPGISYEVKASQEKADFIENDLPALVGNEAFWMDTLTVDQRNAEEVLAIVQSIPTIFRKAKRTVAIRECDGLYDCCMQAVEGFEDYGDFCDKLDAHSREHYEYIANESYNQRLWTLQECLLSHTIQFVVGRNNQPKTKRGDERPGDLKYYKSQLDLSIVKDSLWVLAYCFKGSEGVPGITDFLKAYIHGGTVKNPKNPLRTVAEDIHLGNFLRVNSASHRVATMPRDYIFATMPQFPWYRYPGQAVQMSFGEIYTDLYMQAASAGHAFTCRFTRSMLDRAATDPVEAWQPSPHQPSPTCLGDFMKLIGHRVPEVSNGTVPHVHLTTFVEIKELGGYPNGSTVLTILEVSMKLFQQQWQESHRGGELSKFGNFPSPDWILHPIDAMRRGWRHLDPGWGLRVLESEGGTALYSGPGLDYAEDDLLQEIYSLDDTEAESRADPGDFVSLFEHTRRILDHMWCSKDPMTVDPSQRSDWAGFQHEMRARWTQPLLRTMLLFAAMITCRIPLSAAAWVDRMFVPVYVQYGDDLMVLGLLAKHARSEEGHRDQPRRMCSVGQHLPEMTSGVTHGTQFGRDHFLVEPTTHLPVGVLPDFLPDERTDQRYAQITSMLYAGLCQVDEENHVKILMAPLCVLQKGPAP